MIRTVFIIMLILIHSCQYASEVYKWIDSDGKVHYTDAKNKPKSVNTQELMLKINTYTSVSYEKTVSISNTVIMYSTSWCGYCKKARKYFRANNIQFTEYNIEKNSRAKKRYKELGASGVPVIIYKNRRMNGFSEAGFAHIYK